MGIEILTPADVLQALRLWHGGDIDEWPFKDLRLNQLAAVAEMRVGDLAGSQGPIAHNRAILVQALEMLAESDPEAEELLRTRFEHRREPRDVANSLNISEATLHYRQREGIKKLTRILLKQEKDAGLEWRTAMATRLEAPSYQKLVGIEEPRTHLRAALQADPLVHIAVIDGLGGIGKTALADRVVRDLIQTNHFVDIAWVTAKQTHLSAMGRLQVESGRPALTLPMLVETLANQLELAEAGSEIKRQRVLDQYLRETACLIVIDNLETVADYRSLLPELRRWQSANSKFILTSRHRLLDEFGLFSISLSELPPAAAIELLRTEAARMGFSEMAAVPDKELLKIYDTVGGNPLALKLIVGQLRFHSLSAIIDRFSRTEKVALFDYIYSEIWETLSDEKKLTLMALGSATESGLTLDHLTAVSELSEAVLIRSLEDLISLSLVDPGGTPLERTFRLHRLTAAFLLRSFGAYE